MIPVELLSIQSQSYGTCLCLCVWAACLQHGVGKEWERAQADGENMPAAELTVFITKWVCVIASVHNFYSIYCLS